MQELHNQLLAATDSLEIIEISDKILYERFNRYIKHMFLKGESLLSLGRFDDALSIFEQILEYDDDRFTGRAHNSLGFCYYMKNEFEKANCEFEKAHEYCDKASLLLNSATLNLATYYSMTNQKENTFKIFKELYDLNPSNGYEDSYILILAMSNNPQEFIEIYDSTIDESNSTDVNVLLEKGVALLQLERLDEAIPVFEDIVKYSDDREIIGVAHTHIGYCYFRNTELDKAISEYEKAREYSDELSISDELSMLHSLAHTYQMANQKEKALEVLKELYEIDPNNQNIKKKIENLEREINGKNLLNGNNFNSIEEAILQANIYWQRDEYEKAIEVYDLITDFLPEHPPSWHNKGFSYYQLGKYKEAMKCFDKALEYNPNSVYSMFYKSSIYMEEEDFMNAEDMIIKALMIQPDNEDFLINYCYILTKLGKTKEAIDIAEKKLNIKPEPHFEEIDGSKGFYEWKF